MVGKTYAYAGKILRINLSNRRITTESTVKYADRFLGGRGINQWILYKEVRPKIWPFDPANRLIFGTGVLVGTCAPAAGRYTVDSKNVFTGGVGSANSGGHFGPELKFAGYDNLVIHGRSRKPCYLWIDDDTVKIRNAEHLWGKTTWETDDIIRENLGDEDVQIASIGPAGENLVRAACIINNGARAAGRCGLGAVMGSKNLKAIAVRGTGGISVADPARFMRVVEELWQRIEGDDVMKSLRQWSTALIPEADQAISSNPVRNFQDGYWDPEKIKKTSSKVLIGEYSVRNLACFGCPVACSHYLKISKGEFAGVEGEGFECNTLHDLGCKLDIDNLSAIIKIHVLCGQYGLDVDNTGGVIAWAMECYEKGILKKEDTDGLELDWGNYKATIELVRKIALREGFGDLLAEGSKRASEMIGRGSEKYSMNIKGQELYETLIPTIGWGLGPIVSARGGGHLRGAPICEFPYLALSPEEGEKYFGIPTAGDRKTYEGKAKLVIYFQNLKAIVDCFNICYFPTQWYSPPLINMVDLAKLFSTATGRELSAEDLREIGERITNVEKAYNVREGIRKKDDWPPERFFEPIPSGPAKGESLHREKLSGAIEEYYELMGWDTETGIPTRRKLEELGLKEVEEDLDKLGLLAR